MRGQDEGEKAGRRREQDGFISASFSLPRANRQARDSSYRYSEAGSQRLPSISQMETQEEKMPFPTQKSPPETKVLTTCPDKGFPSLGYGPCILWTVTHEAFLSPVSDFRMWRQSPSPSRTLSVFRELTVVIVPWLRPAGSPSWKSQHRGDSRRTPIHKVRELGHTLQGQERRGCYRKGKERTWE